MNPIITKLPIVNASEVQKNFKRIVEEVKIEGYKFVMNKGNPQIVMVSIPFYSERLDIAASKEKHKKMSKKEKQKVIAQAFGIWKDDKRSWKEILKELRRDDNKKPFDVYIQELLKWQKQFQS